MATFNKFNAFVADVANKVHNLGADTLKVMLTNTAPVATNAVKADTPEIAAGNGYTAGGTQATLVSSSQTSGTYALKLGWRCRHLRHQGRRQQRDRLRQIYLVRHDADAKCAEVDQFQFGYQPVGFGRGLCDGRVRGFSFP